MVHHPNPLIQGAKPVPKTRLSDVGLRALQPPAKGTLDYWDATLPSFGCRVSQGGAKTFILKLNNSRRAIGRWPLISLAEARGEAKLRPQSITVSQAVELFLAEKAKGRRPRTVADLKDRLTRHFSITGQLADVTHQEVVRRLSRIKTPQEHNAALRVGKTFFTWAMNRRYISDNPFRGISPHSTTSRSRVLSNDELKAVWSASEQLGRFGVIAKLLILTGARRGEIAAQRLDR
jgi:integrase